MFKNVKAWDPTVLTEGSIIKVSGFSPINDFTFQGKEYRVKKFGFLSLTIRSKNGKTYDLEPWEIGEDDVTIEIVKQVPYRMPF